MKFNIDNYKGKYVMHCKTEEEARSFCNYLHNVGRKWCIGTSYLETINYQRYKEFTVYDFNNGTMCNVDYYKSLSENYTILEWEDFMKGTFTKADLKTGDVVKRRNGHIEIVNLELGMFILKSGWNDLDVIRSDLTCMSGQNFDIVAVRRPKTKGDCQFNAFDHKWGTLVYERKEVEEMTLEQVCKLLGKEIKIIK